VGIERKIRADVTGRYQAQGAFPVGDDVQGRGIEILGKKGRSFVALQAPQTPGAAIDKICQPIFDVRRIGARLDQV
jgi:hypothetical protein